MTAIGAIRYEFPRVTLRTRPGRIRVAGVPSRDAEALGFERFALLRGVGVFAGSVGEHPAARGPGDRARQHCLLVTAGARRPGIAPARTLASARATSSPRSFSSPLPSASNTISASSVRRCSLWTSLRARRCRRVRVARALCIAEGSSGALRLGDMYRRARPRALFNCRRRGCAVLSIAMARGIASSRRAPSPRAITGTGRHARRYRRVVFPPHGM